MLERLSRFEAVTPGSRMRRPRTSESRQLEGHAVDRIRQVGRLGQRPLAGDRPAARARPHCHSAEDEFFVVLDGEGTLHADPTPTKVEFGGQSEEHPRPARQHRVLRRGREPLPLAAGG